MTDAEERPDSPSAPATTVSRPGARLRHALTQIFSSGEPRYLRRESSSQTPAIAKKQEESGEIWVGSTAISGSRIVQVSTPTLAF